MTDEELLDDVDGRVVPRSVLDRALQLHHSLADGPSGQAWAGMAALVKTIASLHPDYMNITRTCSHCCKDDCTAPRACGRHQMPGNG